MRHAPLRFHCVLTREGARFVGLCVDLDVSSHGTTVAEAKRNLREAVTLYLESAVEANLPHLRPVPAAEDPRRSAPAGIVSSFDMEVAVRFLAHA